MSLLSNRSVIRVAANVATASFLLMIVFQFLLAFGIMPISMAWGGRQSELTLPLRAASLAAAVLLGLFLLVIRRRAGLIGTPPIPTSIRILSWLITALLVLNTLGNLTSPSVGERLLFGPITVVLTVACLLVSASRLET